MNEQKWLESPYQKQLQEDEEMGNAINDTKEWLLSDAHELAAAYPGDMQAMMERMLTVLTELAEGRTNTPSAVYYLETMRREMATDAAEFMLND